MYSTIKLSICCITAKIKAGQVLDCYGPAIIYCNSIVDPFPTINNCNVILENNQYPLQYIAIY